MMPASNVKYEDADHTPSPHLSLEMQPLGTLATPMAMCHWTAATAASHKCNSKLFIIPPMAQFRLQFSFFLLLKIMFFFLAIWGKTNLETQRPILIWHQCMCAKVRNNDIANGVWQFCPDRSGTKYRPMIYCICARSSLLLQASQLNNLQSCIYRTCKHFHLIAICDIGSFALPCI